jgi:hypothetical protein
MSHFFTRRRVPGLSLAINKSHRGIASRKTSCYISRIEVKFDTSLTARSTQRRKPQQIALAAFSFPDSVYGGPVRGSRKTSPVNSSAGSRSVNSFRAATILDGMRQPCFDPEQE